MSRKPKVEGVRQDRISSRSRGFANISVKENDEKKTKTRFERRRKEKGCDDADTFLNALLDASESAAPSVPIEAPKVPWEAIRQALLDEFGFIDHEKIDRALQSAGMSKEEV